MQNVPQWAKSILELAKLNEKHFYNVKIIALWGVIFFLVNVLISGKDSDCDKIIKEKDENYKNLKEICNVYKSENIYLTKGKSDCLKEKDTLHALYFRIKSERDSLENEISILKNK